MTPREAFDKYLYDERLTEWIDTRDHLETFRKMAKGEVLEIGVNTGISTSAFLLGIEENGGHLTSIDIRPECGKTWEGHPNWTFIAGDSMHAIPDKDWDLVFIDGNHTYEYVKSDMLHVRKIGLMHDICAVGSFPGVRQAFDEWQGYKEILSEKSYGLGLISSIDGQILADKYPMFDPIAIWWDEEHKSGTSNVLVGSPGKQEWEYLAVEDLIRPDVSVLNIGVGTGIGTKDLYIEGCIVDVLDISSIALKKVSGISRHQYLHSTEIPSNTYDVALSFLVAQHMSHDALRKQLSNVIRSLKPSGIFAIQVPSPMDYVGLGDDAIALQKLGTVVRSPESFSAMVSDAGGKIIKQISMGIFPNYSFEWLTYHIVHA